MLNSTFAICGSGMGTMIFIRTENRSRHSGAFGKQIHGKSIFSEGTCSFFLTLKAFSCHLQGLWLSPPRNSLTYLATGISESAANVLAGPGSPSFL